MGKVLVGVLAFAAGAAVGGGFVAWYVKRHYLELGGKELGDKIFGAGSTGSAIVAGIFPALDNLRAN